MTEKHYIVLLNDCKLLGFTRSWYRSGKVLIYLARRVNVVWERLPVGSKHWYDEVNVIEKLRKRNCIREISREEVTAILLTAEPWSYDY
jgi:hypothetical protein